MWEESFVDSVVLVRALDRESGDLWTSVSSSEEGHSNPARRAPRVVRPTS